jgi:hypothetical protein
MNVSSFEHACKLLRLLRVEYNTDYDYGKQGTEKRHQFDVPCFTRVRLPLSPLEWCQVCMRDGWHYAGGCCATCSAIQDILSHAFRFGSGWIDMQELGDMAQLWEEHGEGDQIVKFSEEPDEFHHKAFVDSRLDPWEKIALVWHIAKNFYEPRVPGAYGDHLRELDKAVSLLGSSLHALSIHRMFDQNEIHTLEGQKVLEGQKSQDQASWLIILSRILPALKTLNEQIDQLGPPPMEGWALIDLEKGPDAVASNGLGLCLYRTEEEVEHLLQLWREQEGQREEKTERKGKIDDRIRVRRVRVTREKGIEFLD